jgi:protocatechuate 3,4-dioxygenase beta subunit
VPLTLNIQLIDVKTCEPVPRIYLEAWHCNATGVYSGVVPVKVRGRKPVKNTAILLSCG